ncbi:MAG: MFS transporter [Paracoccaceae bacterium]
MSRSERGPIIGLAIAETAVWAGLFYTFPILLLRFEADFGWWRDEVALAFTLALAAQALAAPLAGRVVDRGYGAAMLPLAAIAGGACLIGLSLIESRTGFYALWTLIGFFAAFCLYEPCFAFLVRVKGVEARGAITLVTLVAGFASTLAFPLADWIAQEAGWRAAIQVFAAGAILIAAPLFYWSARRLSADGPARPTKADGVAAREAAKAARRRTAFWLLAVTFPLVALTHGAMISHLMPILDSRGALGAEAVIAASLIGPAQVAGRIAITIFARRRAALSLMIGGYITAGVAYLLLLSASEPDWRIYTAIIAIGAANGVLSIAKPLTTMELLGREGYGAIAGALATPFIAGFAAAPYLAVVIWRVGAYELLLRSAAALALLGAGLLMTARIVAARASRD